MVDLGAGAVLLVAEALYHLRPPMLHSATHMLTTFYVQPSRRSDDQRNAVFNIEHSLTIMQRNAVFNIEHSLTIMRSFFLLSCRPLWEPSYASVYSRHKAYNERGLHELSPFFYASVCRQRSSYYERGGDEFSPFFGLK